MRHCLNYRHPKQEDRKFRRARPRRRSLAPSLHILSSLNQFRCPPPLPKRARRHRPPRRRRSSRKGLSSPPAPQRAFSTSHCPKFRTSCGIRQSRWRRSPGSTSSLTGRRRSSWCGRRRIRRSTASFSTPSGHGGFFRLWTPEDPSRPLRSFECGSKYIEATVREQSGGGGRNRTGVHGFAGRCMTTLPPRRVLETGNSEGFREPAVPAGFWSGRGVSNSRP